MPYKNQADKRASDKKAMAKYLKTPKGQAARREKNRRYRKGAAGQAARARQRRRYRESGKQALAVQRWSQTEVGRISRKRAVAQRRTRHTDIAVYIRRCRKMIRDEEPCLRCGISAEQIDHILPLAMGGTDDWRNFQSLCLSCHRQKTNEDNRQIAAWKRSRQI